MAQPQESNRERMVAGLEIEPISQVMIGKPILMLSGMGGGSTGVACVCVEGADADREMGDTGWLLLLLRLLLLELLLLGLLLLKRRERLLLLVRLWVRG